MIQEADIGVGISGVEGMQAVMASDFSIAQFRFLERLLVVHGHWCYKRIAQMVNTCGLIVDIQAVASLPIEQHNLILYHIFFCHICYFFYKNITFGLTLFYFECFTGFSGQAVYNDSYLLLFNVILTSLPVISLGVFEQDVSSEWSLCIHSHRKWSLCIHSHLWPQHWHLPCSIFLFWWPNSRHGRNGDRNVHLHHLGSERDRQK